MFALLVLFLFIFYRIYRRMSNRQTLFFRSFSDTIDTEDQPKGGCFMKLRKLLCMLLCILMILQYAAVPVFANENDEGTESTEVVSEKEAVIRSACTVAGMPDNNELFSYYVEQKLYGYEFSTFGTKARELLNPVEQQFYDVLKAKIEDVAARGGSAIFELSNIPGLKTTFTNKDLGVNRIDDFDLIDAAFNAQFNLDAIHDALLNDCPFDLYWYDKTSGYYMPYSISCSSTTAWITDMEMYFSVSLDYQGGDDTTVTSNVARIDTAKANAAKLVADCASLSDYRKIVAYKDYILEAVDYNHAAVENDAPYGDPWQVIYVFDGDSSTDVVCEGYSKALQYLCDLSWLDCICADGITNGPHMWNVVTLEGKNYLVDLTNCDEGSIGSPDLLFLVGGTYENGAYHYPLYSIDFTYTCQDLNLSDTNYSPSAAPSTYTVSVDAGIANGTVTAEPANAEPGTEITLTVTPYDGYELDSISAIYGENQNLDITDSKFVMPAADVTVTASFKAHIHSYGNDGFCACGAECDHTAAATAIANGDGHTHRTVCACGQYTVAEAEPHSTAAEGDIVPDCHSTGYCTVCESNYTPGHDVQDEICVWCGLYGTCGESAVWTYDPESKTLTVSGTGMATGRSWDDYTDFIITVIVEEGITGLGQRFFMNCRSMTGISLPESLQTIDSMAFAGCYSLNGITIPQRLTDIASDAFIMCNNLNAFCVADGSVAFTAVDGVLFNKDLTMLVSFPAGKAAASYRVPNTVTVIGNHAFYQCAELRSVSLPEGVHTIGNYAFYQCYMLDDIQLPDSLMSIELYAFGGCYGLTSIVLPEELMFIGAYAFDGCFCLTDAHYLGDPENLLISIKNAYLTEVLHGCVMKDAVSGNCTIPGHGEGWYCESCEKYFSGAETDVDPDTHVFADGSCIYCGTDEPSNITVTAHPTDYIGLVGEIATFTVAAEGEGLKYQWYYYDTAACDWKRASNGTFATLSVEFRSYRNNQEYRCVITDSDGNTVTTDTVRLVAKEVDLSILTQPMDYVGSVNDELSLFVEATGNGLIYQWYYSDDNGTTWKISGTPGFNTATLHPILRAYRDGYQYKCQVTDVFGNQVTSDAVSATVETSPVIISAQPVDVKNAVLNQLQTFKVTASGVNLEYRWEYSSDGGKTWQLSWNEGYSTDTLTARLYAYRDGYLYRCKITSGLKTVVYSNAVVMDMQDPSVTLIGQPKHVYSVAGKIISFHADVTGNDLTYQWYRSNDQGATWIKTYLDGYNTDTLNFAANTSRAVLYKLQVTDGSGKVVWSNAVKLQILSTELKILSQPQSVTCANGITATFTVAAQGDTLQYRWFYSSDGGTTWTASYLDGYNTDTFSFPVTAARAAKLYKCVITDAAGNTVNTNCVSITIC